MSLLKQKIKLIKRKKQLNCKYNKLIYISGINSSVHQESKAYDIKNNESIVKTMQAYDKKDDQV